MPGGPGSDATTDLRSLAGEDPALADCYDQVAHAVARGLEALDQLRDFTVIQRSHLPAGAIDQELPHQILGHEVHLVPHLLLESDDVTEGLPIRQASRCVDRSICITRPPSARRIEV